MKKQLLLFTISAAALAVSADCQAMYRRAPKAAMPSIPQRGFSFKAKKDFSLPYVPSAKINLATIKRHTNLVADLEKSKQHESKIKNAKRKQIVLTAVPLAAIPLALHKSHILCDEIDFINVGVMAIGAKSLWSLSDVEILLTKSSGILTGIRESKTVETELEELVKEQKRQLRIPDDIQ